MKVNKLISIVFMITMFCGTITNADAVLYPTPLTSTDFTNLLNPSPIYGPPPAASFPNGPTSILNDGTSKLISGPPPGQVEGTNDVDYLLFVISFDPVLSGFGPGSVDFTLAGSPEATLTFTNSSDDGDNFYYSSEIGFPSNIPGIGNGEVGGVKFPSAQHGALLADLPFSPTIAPEIDIGDVTVDSTILPLRIDVFSLIFLDGTITDGPPNFTQLRIVGNNSNSHSLAVVPEPATMLLLGTGLIGFAVVGRKKFFKKG